MYCLFASFGQVKSITYYVNGDLCSTPFEYRRPSIHKSQMAICFKCWKLVKITEVEPRKEYYSGWGRWAYDIESEDLMKDHWNNSCSSQRRHNFVGKVIIPSTPNFEPACISPTRQETILPSSYQSSSSSQRRSEQGITSEIFISSWYAKQNNLLQSINHLNQLALRLRDGIKITFV